MKLRKELLTAFVGVFVMLFVWNICAFAAGTHSPRVVDDADLLTEEEEIALEEYLDQCSEAQLFDIVVYTTIDFEQATAEAAADDFYDYNYYGIDDNRSGTVLFIAIHDNQPGNRDWHISTKGDAISIVTANECDAIGESIYAAMQSGDFYSAFVEYGTTVYNAVEDARTFHAFRYLLISIIFGAVVGGIYILVLKNQLKSVAPSNGAVEYVKKGSMKVSESREMYLYKNLTVVPRAQNNDSNPTHVSSSGSTHGGSGGKF